MKQTIIFLLFCITALTLSCRAPVSKTPDQFPDGIVWEELLYKNGLDRFIELVFSTDLERFLISDNSSFIKLYRDPFTSAEAELPIKDDKKLVTVEFFGDQDDISLVYRMGFFQIWDKQLLQKKYEVETGTGGKRAFISRDGRFLAIGGNLFDRQKNGLVGDYVGHSVQSGLSYHGGSLVVTSGYHDRSIAVRNVHDGKYEISTTRHPIYDSGLSPDEKYIVGTTDKGRCYLWNWPDPKPKKLAVTRGPTHFVGFSPDSKWFVVYGFEFVHIFRTNPPARIARFQPQPAQLSAVQVASNNLIVMGDVQGNVSIYDVAAGKIITRRKVCKHTIGPIQLSADKGILWAGSSGNDMEEGEKGEIALFRIKGLEPYIEPKSSPGPK